MTTLLVLMLLFPHSRAQETYLPGGLREGCEKFKTTRKQFDELPEAQSAKCREAMRSSMQACREKNGPSQSDLNGIVVGAGAKGAANAQRQAFEDSRDVFLAQAKACEDRRAQAKDVCGADYMELKGKYTENALARADLERQIAAAPAAQRGVLQTRLRENLRLDRTLREDMGNSEMMGKLGDRGLEQLSSCNVGEAKIYDEEANRANTVATSISSGGASAANPTDQRGLIDKYGPAAQSAATDNVAGTVAGKGIKGVLTRVAPLAMGPVGLAVDTAVDQVTAGPTSKCDEVTFDPVLAYNKGCRATIPQSVPAPREPSSDGPWQELTPSGY